MVCGRRPSGGELGLRLEPSRSWRVGFPLLISALPASKPFPSAATQVVNQSAKDQRTRVPGVPPRSPLCGAGEFLLGPRAADSALGWSGRTSADLGLVMSLR